MNTRLLTPAALLLTLSPLWADVTNYVRPDFQNITATGTLQQKNPYVIFWQGHIKPVASAPSDGAVRLTEAAFGQPFAPYLPDGDGNAAYAARIAEDVRTVLYPPAGANRTIVETSGTAFRYKWLLFSPNPGETDVTNHFENIDAWFSAADRATVNTQIAKLRDAIAAAPLDTGLRHLLLDCYYDLAVAEMQGAKKKLATLATKRLGLQLTSPFIIDEEIATYQELVTLLDGVLGKYAELLSFTAEGVDPAEFDERLPHGMPMGYYIFIHEQPYRNSVASQYATSTDTATVPTYDEGNQSVVPRPAGEVLFSGYKDYTTYLRIMADYIRYHAELARLRGMRQGPNDVTTGRNALAKIMRETMLDFVLLRGLYPASQFPPGDASGVNAALSAVETAMADTVNVRAFLNGTANVLGLDPNFLLLVQESTIDGTRYFDSFDILRQRLKGPNQPLSEALAKKTDAEARYNNFRSSVDKVVQELSDVDESYQNRFVEITGYTPAETPGFNGFAKPNSGSELDLVEQTIANLERRSNLLTGLSANLQNDLSDANKAVKVAEGLSAAVDSATDNYISRTSSAWTEIHSWAGISAGAQAAAEAAYTVAGLDGASTLLSAGGTAKLAIVTGVVNTAIQTAAAARTSQRQQELDYAAMGFESTTEKTDAALMVNQARQEAGNIKREQYAQKLEMEDNTSTLGQALAQRTALLNEVQRITASRSANTQAVRSKFYADPIHYIRAENALIEADESFRDAQRWIFYTLKALEYKWQQKFSRTDGSRSYDTGTIFKLRNAKELDDMLSQMVQWDAAREAENIPGEGTSFISLKNDVLTPNPGVLRATGTADTGTRVDFLTGETVTQTELFRRKVLRQMDGSGYIQIPFDTVLLEDLNGNFFRGPDYISNTNVIPGKWRDKIAYVKVNIIAEDGAVIPQTRLGSLSYGGNTFTRTRIPPCANRLRPTNAPISSEAQDIFAEFTVAPFRFYSSANYDNVFVSADTQSTSIDMAYTGATARSQTGEEILGSTFQVNAFNQRSVAATRWVLTINPGQLDVSRLKDIEIIVKHRFSDRVAPVCP